MIKCPNCHEPSISVWDKLFIGTTILSRRCKHCNKKLSLDFKRYVGLIVLIIVSLLAFADEYPSMFILLVPIFCFLFIKWVPLKVVDN